MHADGEVAGICGSSYFCADGEELKKPERIESRRLYS